MAVQEVSPIQSPIPAERQNAKRHYGVHPYFTRRPYNVVRDYIVHYSSEHDSVLDPFGGSGVTAIEAFLNNRLGIQNDINPLANFIASGIVRLSEGGIDAYETGFVELKNRCQAQVEALQEKSETQISELLESLALPRDIELPKSSDVRHYFELFTARQLAALSILKRGIDVIEKDHVRNAMLLAWSATLAKLNRTFLSAEGRAESRGGSSIFSIYRYKIAKEPVELPAWKTFAERASNVISAKAEIDKIIEHKRMTGGWSGRFESCAFDIEELAERRKNSVDYIFTDPPYGGHISYLDLSTLWNNWLNQLPTEEARRKELIVGGDLALGESAYTAGLGRSIAACLRMLKRERWLSVVFQHWNIIYFQSILDAAAENGAELRAAVPQVGDTIWSMHKKKGNESVLAGELILTFHNSGKVNRAPRRSNFQVDTTINEILSRVKDPVMYGEHLFNELILKAWHKGAIGSLQISKDDFNDLIRQQGWHYDPSNHCWVKNQFGGLFPAG